MSSQATIKLFLTQLFVFLVREVETVRTDNPQAYIYIKLIHISNLPGDFSYSPINRFVRKRTVKATKKTHALLIPPLV